MESLRLHTALYSMDGFMEEFPMQILDLNHPGNYDNMQKRKGKGGSNGRER